MWIVKGLNLQMAEGDYGLTLPITVDGAEITTPDTLRITVRSENGQKLILEKDMRPTENTVEFTLTQTESEALRIGNYEYSLDWYRGNTFLCNIIPAANLRVVNKV